MAALGSDAYRGRFGRQDSSRHLAVTRPVASRQRAAPAAKYQIKNNGMLRIAEGRVDVTLILVANFRRVTPLTRAGGAHEPAGYQVRVNDQHPPILFVEVFVMRE